MHRVKDIFNIYDFVCRRKEFFSQSSGCHFSSLYIELLQKFDEKSLDLLLRLRFFIDTMASTSKWPPSSHPTQSIRVHYRRLKPGLCLPHLLLDNRLANGFRKNILTLLHSYYVALTMSILLILDLLLVIGEIILTGYMGPVVQLSTACNATELKPNQEPGAAEVLYRVPVDCGFTVDLALPHHLEVKDPPCSPLPAFV